MIISSLWHCTAQTLYHRIAHTLCCHNDHLSSDIAQLKLYTIALLTLYYVTMIISSLWHCTAQTLYHCISQTLCCHNAQFHLYDIVLLKLYIIALLTLYYVTMIISSLCHWTAQTLYHRIAHTLCSGWPTEFKKKISEQFQNISRTFSHFSWTNYWAKLNKYFLTNGRSKQGATGNVVTKEVARKKFGIQEQFQNKPEKVAFFGFFQVHFQYKTNSRTIQGIQGIPEPLATLMLSQWSSHLYDIALLKLYTIALLTLYAVITLISSLWHCTAQTPISLHCSHSMLSQCSSHLHDIALLKLLYHRIAHTLCCHNAHLISMTLHCSNSISLHCSHSMLSQCSISRTSYCLTFM